MLRFVSVSPRWLVAGLLLTAACGGHEASPAQVRASLLGADSAFAQASARIGVRAWLEYYEPAGVIVRPGRSVTGHAAIHQLMAPTLADSAFTLTWAPLEAEVDSSGATGWTRGRWEATRRGAADTVVTRGTYLNLWRLAADGRWRIALDIGEPDVPDTGARATERLPRRTEGAAAPAGTIS